MSFFEDPPPRDGPPNLDELVLFGLVMAVSLTIAVVIGGAFH